MLQKTAVMCSSHTMCDVFIWMSADLWNFNVLFFVLAHLLKVEWAYVVACLSGIQQKHVLRTHWRWTTHACSTNDNTLICSKGVNQSFNMAAMFLVLYSAICFQNGKEVGTWWGTTYMFLFNDTLSVDHDRVDLNFALW